MEEKKIEDEISLKGQVLRNNAKTEIDKWYPLKTEYRIVKPYKEDGFRVEIVFPSDVRTGINPSSVEIRGGKEKSRWMCRYSHADDFELKNLQTEVNDLRRRNGHLQSMIQTFWNLNNFKDKHLLMKKVRLETIEKMLAYLDYNKLFIEEEYGDDDYLDMIDEFINWLQGSMEELKRDFEIESNEWKLWYPEDYEKPVKDLSF